MTGPFRLGVIGSLVWDRIYPHDSDLGLVEGWGGISYSLAALAAELPPGWEIVPLLRLGRELEGEGRDLLGGMPGLDPGSVQVVPEENYRVELRYTDAEQRTERLLGGVPGWEWPELEPLLAGIDALYINFITGYELDLGTATRVRENFSGPIYADLHSLFLGRGSGGDRFFRPLSRWAEWLRAFDIVQMNEAELRCLAGERGDPWEFAARLVGTSPQLLLVTLGSRGAGYLGVSPAGAAGRSGGGARPEQVVRGVVPAEERVDGDPTGCGDVWGATAFLAYLRGLGVEEAVQAANQAAARKVRYRGVSGLHEFLRGQIAR